MKKHVVLVVAMLAAEMATVGSAVGLASADTRECIVRVKAFVISGSVGEAGVSLPVFPDMSLALLEETIQGLDDSYEKLRSLYAFTEYRLLAMAASRVRLAGYPRPVATVLEGGSTKAPNGWIIEWRDFSWDSEGRLQLLVRIAEPGGQLIQSHISVLPGRSVVLGRFRDERMTQAVFAVLVPEIEVAVAGESPLSDGITREATVASKQVKIGLPSAAPFPTPSESRALPDEDDFVEAAEQPVAMAIVQPEYPETAKRENAEGKVWLRSLIDETGTVRQCKVVRSSGRADLDSAAVEAGRKSEYRPARDKNGSPISIWVAYKTVFKLQQ